MAPPTRSANQDAMMQMLQMMMEDREAERAERQANIAALQQIAQNNQGHGNHDHPGSKLKNFQNTNPPMFSKTEEPLDADDWLHTMENNLEVAGVEAAEKVLFATHYLSGPARAWWTSARAMNAGQMMTWEDFKLKFSKYHVPQGLIKKLRDEFRELKQGRMSVVEYRDRFLSRYAPDETDTNEKRKERFLNGLHDEMQTVLVNIPFADLEALVDSAIQMEGKLHQANENRKRRMMNQNGPHHTQKYRNNSSGGFTPRHNKPPAQNYRPNYTNNNGGLIRLQRSYFCTKLPKTERITKWATRRRTPGRGREARAARVWPRVALDLPFRLLKASVAKPPTESHDTENLRRRRESHLGDSEIASGTLPERGFISRRTLHRHDRLRSDD
ncbi:hypothetical protein QYE76_066854 [Lolium multiflorum]|uniref:Retrotransposon gag domain-containing protein n=1 Tax=Lolium multiflorum TaxID=4521 RepID=A0AAD8SBQ2_LOLMU|nr:hypothetical protein QYE76_066854 [Lolium multiflorum]